MSPPGAGQGADIGILVHVPPAPPPMCPHATCSVGRHRQGRVPTPTVYVRASLETVRGLLSFHEDRGKNASPAHTSMHRARQEEEPPARLTMQFLQRPLFPPSGFQDLKTSCDLTCAKHSDGPRRALFALALVIVVIMTSLSAAVCPQVLLYHRGSLTALYCLQCLPR